MNVSLFSSGLILLKYIKGFKRPKLTDVLLSALKLKRTPFYTILYRLQDTGK